MSQESTDYSSHDESPRRESASLPEADHSQEPTPPSAQESPVNERSNPLLLLKPAEGYVVTPVLIWINVGIFILMALTGVNVLQPASEDLIRWGANYTPLTLEGQPWRLLSSCFLHIGVLHLLFNMYALMQIGPVLEPLLGSRQFTVAYFTAGLLGSVVSLWWHDIVLGAGASGAIFGLYGVFLALLTTNWLDAETRRDMLKSILIFVGYNLAIGLQAGIDNAAHIGGLVAGLFFGYAYYYAALHPSRAMGRLGWPTLIPPIVTCLVAAFVYANTSNVFVDYERIMNRFGQLEKQSMDVFRLPPNTPSPTVANAFRKGVVSWQKAIELLNDADQLELSEKYRQRNSLLRQYSTLRLNSFRLLQKSLTENTHDYDNQIDMYDRQIQAVLSKLNKK